MALKRESGKKAKRRIRNRTRLKSALELRAEGLSFEEIGKRLVPPVTRQSAFGLVRRGLQEMNEDLAESADEIRRLELERLDDLLRGLWAKRKGLGTVDRILKVMERRAKLVGIDAPVKLEQSRPDNNAGGQDLARLTIDELRELEAILAKSTVPLKPIEQAAE